ncbi:hypothetical protein G9C85_01070 [Halorubellus sp. JP-L1]|uniref:hypothetical protein n=1 Tax=Halorubellus sp. JP-L1 TaxID=2715753 RepID=UPI00140E6EA5|nr:hypothetical protein [Halorubellus sp. JP-L1]NHN40227.1 hypothetical protein [Halorubellus sp. JP-L1]
MLGRLRAFVRSHWPDDDGSVWNAIPGRQYGGRHAEAGGLSRSEQEDAIQDVQEQAEALDGR